MSFVMRMWRPLGAASLALLLSACSMGDMFGPGPGGPNASAKYADVNTSQADLVAASSDALPAIATECPPIRVRAGGEAMFKYVNNSKPNPRELNYQAVIDKQSRNCVVSNGKITIRMGVVGRLLLGPAGSVDSTEIPIRFAIERDGTALFTEAYRVPVAVPAGEQSAEFVKVAENVEIPYLGGETITIWVGFDSRA
jgi:hypothetical protein